MRELVLHCQEAQAEALSDALLEAGVLSVSVEDADLGTDDERPLFGEPGTICAPLGFIEEMREAGRRAREAGTPEEKRYWRNRSYDYNNLTIPSPAST